MPDNVLYYGDNLEVLRRHVASESVDLVYLDPPFNSNADYNVLFTEKAGEGAHAQIQAFEDTWTWDIEAARNFTETVENGGQHVARCMMAFKALLGQTDMLAYMSMMAPRLIELRRVLKPTGSIYLHCDSTAGAYLRVLMDSIFEPKNFRNEIIWYYYNKMHDRRKKLFPNANDTILFYVKDVEANFTFHQLKEKRDKPVKQLARKKVDGKMVNAKDAEGHVIYRLKEDRTIDNVWRIPCLQPAAPERLGYQTQKPELILDRIIEASTNEGDLVLDPFCGCGTTIAAAQRLHRRWIGIDITHLAIKLIKGRLADAFTDRVSDSYKVIGEPTDLEGARALAQENKYQFQFWALGLAHPQARPLPRDEKKGADRGIDGRMTLQDANGNLSEVVFSVKGGHVNPSQIRDLCGVIASENAAIGVFICIEDVTPAMRAAAANAGFFQPKVVGASKHPRLQILTIQDLLDGKRIDLPAQTEVRSFKRAPKARRKGHAQHALPFDEQSE